MSRFNLRKSAGPVMASIFVLGVVLAAGAVVTRDVLPYDIVGGVPAKVIGKRTPQADPAKLAESQWWKSTPEDAIKIVEGLESTEWR